MCLEIALSYVYLGPRAKRHNVHIPVSGKVWMRSSAKHPYPSISPPTELPPAFFPPTELRCAEWPASTELAEVLSMAAGFTSQAKQNQHLAAL